MARHFFSFLMLATFFVLNVSTLPANQEQTTTHSLDLLSQHFVPQDEVRQVKSLPQEQVLTEVFDDNTKEIIEKIRAINDGLKKPPRTQQINWNKQPQTGGGYTMDKEILEKLQQIIASGKLHGLPHTHENHDIIENFNDIRYSRKLNSMQRNQLPIMPIPYMINFPILTMPSTPNMNNGYLMAEEPNSLTINPYQTKQSPLSSLFQFQWPFASFFPILIRDPLLNSLNGGGWSNLIEYGQSADVCSREHKSVHTDKDEQENIVKHDNSLYDNTISLDSNNNYISRKSRSIKKRKVNHRSRRHDIEDSKSPKKIFSTKSASIKKPAKQTDGEEQSSKTTVNESGLRFPFGDFGWFGNKKVVQPPPGFYINKLRVRKGGVAIAGPGGVATAGKGGAAIVGPGGLAYTQPGGLAVAGPAARVVALSPEVNLSSVVDRLQQQATTDGSVPQLLQAIPEGKVVATGPVIYYHPKQQYQRDSGIEPGEANSESSGNDEYRYDGVNFRRGSMKIEDSQFLLFLKPVAHAISAKGSAIANPVSQVVIARNRTGSIVHTPVASAIVGPGGIGHAQSDLYLYEYVTV